MTDTLYRHIVLSDILKPVSRPESLKPDHTYRLLGAHWYGLGLYVKDVKPGSLIQADRLFQVRSGDFVYNRLFGWKGSFAVATEEHEGCYVSGEFPTFQIETHVAEPSYLAWYYRRQSTWDEALGLSTGGTPTSRNRLKESQFLSMEIPLPPLEEQRRIVARIDALAAKIEEARGLQSQVAKGWDDLCRSILLSSGSKLTPMREVISQRESDVTVVGNEAYDFAGVYCFGGGVFRRQRKSGMEFGYSRLTRLRAGDFVYPKLMAWEGALGIVPPACDGLVVSPEYPVFEVRQDIVLPEVLDVYFRTPSVWPLLAAISTGTNVRRRRLHPDRFLAFEMPLPPRSNQCLLRDLSAKVDHMKALQAETGAELDALLPSVLDRAFRGEL